jgi:hypothetical protein
MMVMGTTPSAGVEAEVARGQFNLPEDIALQVPTGRFTLPDGSIFLEGQGVQLTHQVPVNAENLLSGDDFVLRAAEKAVLEPAGAGVVPSAAPTISSQEDTKEAIQNSGAAFLEQLANEQYENPTVAGETYTYTIALKESEPLIWAFGWCAADEKTLTSNLAAMKVEFQLGDTVLDQTNQLVLTYPNGEMQCQLMAYQLDNWMPGENHLKTNITYTKNIDDGSATYPKGSLVYDYVVYVKP